MNRPIQWQKGSLFCINCAYNIQIYTENFAGIYAYCVRFHMYLCMCVCISQPNFTLNWPYAFINAIQCYACVYVHVWSIPSQSRFINLMPFRFHFVCAKFTYSGKNCMKSETDLFTQRIHKNYAISFDFTA